MVATRYSFAVTVNHVSLIYDYNKELQQLMFDAKVREKLDNYTLRVALNRSQGIPPPPVPDDIKHYFGLDPSREGFLLRDAIAPSPSCSSGTSSGREGQQSGSYTITRTYQQPQQTVDSRGARARVMPNQPAQLGAPPVSFAGPGGQVVLLRSFQQIPQDQLTPHQKAIYSFMRSMQFPSEPICLLLNWQGVAPDYSGKMLQTSESQESGYDQYCSKMRECGREMPSSYEDTRIRKSSEERPYTLPDPLPRHIVAMNSVAPIDGVRRLQVMNWDELDCSFLPVFIKQFLPDRIEDYPRDSFKYTFMGGVEATFHKNYSEFLKMRMDGETVVKGVRIATDRFRVWIEDQDAVQLAAEGAGTSFDESRIRANLVWTKKHNPLKRDDFEAVSYLQSFFVYSISDSYDVYMGCKKKNRDKSASLIVNDFEAPDINFVDLGLIRSDIESQITPTRGKFAIRPYCFWAFAQGEGFWAIVQAQNHPGLNFFVYKRVVVAISRIVLATLYKLDKLRKKHPRKQQYYYTLDEFKLCTESEDEASCLYNIYLMLLRTGRYYNFTLEFCIEVVRNSTRDFWYHDLICRFQWRLRADQHELTLGEVDNNNFIYRIYCLTLGYRALAVTPTDCESCELDYTRTFLPSLNGKLSTAKNSAERARILENLSIFPDEVEQNIKYKYSSVLAMYGYVDAQSESRRYFGYGGAMSLRSVLLTKEEPLEAEAPRLVTVKEDTATFPSEPWMTIEAPDLSPLFTSNFADFVKGVFGSVTPAALAITSLFTDEKSFIVWILCKLRRKGSVSQIELDYKEKAVLGFLVAKVIFESIEPQGIKLKVEEQSTYISEKSSSLHYCIQTPRKFFKTLAYFLGGRAGFPNLPRRLSPVIAEEVRISSWSSDQDAWGKGGQKFTISDPRGFSRFKATLPTFNCSARPFATDEESEEEEGEVNSTPIIEKHLTTEQYIETRLPYPRVKHFQVSLGQLGTTRHVSDTDWRIMRLANIADAFAVRNGATELDYQKHPMIMLIKSWFKEILEALKRDDPIWDGVAFGITTGTYEFFNAVSPDYALDYYTIKGQRCNRFLRCQQVVVYARNKKHAARLLRHNPLKRLNLSNQNTDKFLLPPQLDFRSLFVRTNEYIDREGEVTLETGFYEAFCREDLNVKLYNLFSFIHAGKISPNGDRYHPACDSQFLALLDTRAEVDNDLNCLKLRFGNYTKDRYNPTVSRIGGDATGRLSGPALLEKELNLLFKPFHFEVRVAEDFSLRIHKIVLSRTISVEKLLIDHRYFITRYTESHLLLRQDKIEQLPTLTFAELDSRFLNRVVDPKGCAGFIVLLLNEWRWQSNWLQQPENEKVLYRIIRLLEHASTEQTKARNMFKQFSFERVIKLLSHSGSPSRDRLDRNKALVVLTEDWDISQQKLSFQKLNRLREYDVPTSLVVEQLKCRLSQEDFVLHNDIYAMVCFLVDSLQSGNSDRRLDSLVYYALYSLGSMLSPFDKGRIIIALADFLEPMLLWRLAHAYNVNMKFNESMSNEAVIRDCIRSSCGNRSTRQFIFKRSEIRLIKKIGEGGQGAIYTVRIPESKVIYACKIIPYNRLAKDFLGLIAMELKCILLCNHPNIIKLHGIVFYDTCYVVILPYMTAGTLRDLMNSYQRSGNLNVENAARNLCRILMDILSGIIYLHSRGIIHRDIKPANVVLEVTHSAQGVLKVERAILIDLGLARASSYDDGFSGGTLVYMGPECHNETNCAQSKATDVYAVGVIIFEILLMRNVYPAAWTSDEIKRHVVGGSDDDYSPPAESPNVTQEVKGTATGQLATASTRFFDQRRLTPREMKESLRDNLESDFVKLNSGTGVGGSLLDGRDISQEESVVSGMMRCEEDVLGEWKAEL